MSKEPEAKMCKGSSSSPKERLEALLNDLCFWEIHPNLNEERGKPASSVNTTENADRLLLCRSQSAESRDDDVNSSEVTWRKAIDPMTGKTYYYDVETMASQWEKPAQIRALEKKRKKEQRKRDREFFKEMERNILSSLARGELIPGVKKENTKSEGPPLEPFPSQPATIRIRTISCMNENLLAELHDDTLSEAAKKGKLSNGVEKSSQPKASTKGRPPIPSERPQLPSEQRPPLPSDQRPSMPSEHRPPLPRPTQPADPQSPNWFEFSPDLPHSTYDPTNQESELMHQDSDQLRGELLVDDLGFDSDEASDPAKDDTPKDGPPKKLEKPAAINIHMRRNTGGTIYMKSTMANPDINATIKCVCGVFRAHIVEAVSKNGQKPPTPANVVNVNLEFFQDNHDFPYRRRRETIPSLEEIEKFYHEFYKRSQMEQDTIIMSIIYVERLIKETSGALCPRPDNWCSVLVSCMILASKVWDDLSMWNIDFSNVSAASGLSMFSLQRINQLERYVLMCLNFNVRVAASEYAKYYFLIRTMLCRSGHMDDVARPLSKEDAYSLESRTKNYQDSKVDRRSERRTHSIDWSWIPGGNQKQLGPVLRDTICLEQLVSMK